MSNEFLVKFRNWTTWIQIKLNKFKLNMFNLFRRCQNDEISFDIVAQNGNNVESTVDFVEATLDIVERIVRLVAFDNVASTLLLV